MSPVGQLGVLAFAASVLAVPHVGAWQPKHKHHRAVPAGYSAAAPAGYSAAAPAGYSSPAAPVGYSSSSMMESSSSSAAPASYVSSSSSVVPYPYPSPNATQWGTTGTGTGMRPTGMHSTGVHSTGLPTSVWTSVCTETSTMIWKTTTEYSTYLSTHTFTSTETATVHPVAPTSASMSAAEMSSAGAITNSPEQCTAAEVTVTTKVFETVTVTAGQEESTSAAGAAPAISMMPASNSPAAPAPAPASEAGKDHGETPSAPAPAPIVSSVSTGSSSSTGSSVSSGSSSSSSSIGSTGSSGSSGSGSSTPSSFSPGGKRGLAYNDAGSCDAFYSSPQIGWGYNWGSLPQGLDTSQVSYVPTLWSGSEPFTGFWQTNAQATIDQFGAKWFFSFNEPDMPSQSNMSPQEAASAWMQFMEPYAGQVKLVAPSVTNGHFTPEGGLLGLDWLLAFMDACSGCTIDAVNQHWYDSTGNDADIFKADIQNATTMTGKPVIVSEFGAIGSDSEISDFLNEVMPWMDSNDNVLGYSYFKVGDGFLNEGTGLSSYGQTYATGA